MIPSDQWHEEFYLLLPKTIIFFNLTEKIMII